MLFSDSKQGRPTSALQSTPQHTSQGQGVRQAMRRHLLQVESSSTGDGGDIASSGIDYMTSSGVDYYSSSGIDDGSSGAGGGGEGGGGGDAGGGDWGNEGAIDNTAGPMYTCVLPDGEFFACVYVCVGGQGRVN